MLFKIYNSIFFYLCFIPIFLFHSISDLIYYKVVDITNSIFIYCKLIEILVLLTLMLLLFLCLKFNLLFKLSRKCLDFCTFLFNMILMIFYSELQLLSVLNHDPQSYWDFAFLMGIFLLISLRHIKNIRFRVICFVGEMLYMVVRFKDIYGLHSERITVLTFFILIYDHCKFVIHKKKLNLENKKVSAKKIEKTTFEESVLMKILTECNEQEGLAILDSKKNLIFNNEKVSNMMKKMGNLSSEDLLKLKLNFLSISTKNSVSYPFTIDNYRNDEINDKKTIEKPTIPDFFEIDSEILLNEVLDKFINYFCSNDQTFPSRMINYIQKNDVITAIFDLRNNEAIQKTNEFFQIKLILTVLLKAEKIENFLIKIQSNFDANQFTISEKKNQNKNIFFVSHEMRTPLNCIVSMLQMIQPFLSDDLNEEYITPSIISCNFLLYLVQDLLDMAQMESDKFTINFDEFDVRLLIFDVKELFKIQASLKQVEVVSNVAYDVPEIIISDHRRIRQILINLIGNSLKFLKKNEGKIIIDVSVEPNFPSHIVFAVKDNGIGIKDVDQNKLFMAFGKINNDENKKMNTTGVGLGLMISNNLAMNLHPNKSEGLKVESKYGHGTTFSFIIQDKNEPSNISENNHDKNLNDHYQLILKKGINEKMKFINDAAISHIREDTNPVKEAQKESKEFASKKTFPSIKIIVDSQPKFDTASKLSFSNKNDSIIDLKNQVNTQYSSINQSLYRKNHTKNSLNSNFVLNTKTISRLQGSLVPMSNYNLLCNANGKDSPNKYGIFSAPSMQSFCDIFLGTNDFEAAENKMNYIKDILLLKSCQCSHILIVDDNGFNIYSLRKQLECFNIKIDSANDGAEAIKMVMEFYKEKDKCCKCYYIIFMDIEMPGINGYEASMEIKKFYHSTPEKINSTIIGCSAHISEDPPGKHKHYGMDDFVTKPIIKGRLTLLLSKFLTLEYEFKKNNSV